MRQYERNGVTLDQCADCRGLFLDRGELERLIDAENAWHGAPASAAPSHQQPAAPYPPQQQGYQQPQHYGHGGYPQRKKRKSFLEELFD
jgi:uncharacterized protein